MNRSSLSLSLLLFFGCTDKSDDTADTTGATTTGGATTGTTTGGTTTGATSGGTTSGGTTSGGTTTGGTTSTTGGSTTGGSTSVWGQEALDEVEQLASGHFEGAWEMYGLDAMDRPVSAMTWTDVVTAENPRIEGERALVDVTDVMQFEEWGEYTMSWIEGVLINKDGSAGEQFMEIEGELTIITEIAPDRYEYAGEVTSQDLQYVENVTPANLISGSKYTTKVVTWADDLQTHQVTTETTLEYTDAAGNVDTVSFTSMEGSHQQFAE